MSRSEKLEGCSNQSSSVSLYMRQLPSVDGSTTQSTKSFLNMTFLKSYACGLLFHPPVMMNLTSSMYVIQRNVRLYVYIVFGHIHE